VVLEPTPDTLAELGRARRPGQVLVGFAAETEDHVAGGRRKLAAKHLDLVVVNHVEGAGTAFGAEAADAYLVDAAEVEPLQRTDKDEIARHLLDRVERLLTGGPGDPATSSP
jgi:phosphopantothenoylcysteine decarboxylase/phosphopantothenate--cysteine ligase